MTEYINLESPDEYEVYARQVGDELQDSDSIYVANADEPGDMAEATNSTVVEYREMDGEEKMRFVEAHAPSREWGETADTQTDRGIVGEINREKIDDGAE